MSLHFERRLSGNSSVLRGWLELAGLCLSLPVEFAPIPADQPISAKNSLEAGGAFGET
jgi:hypothetical protein